MKIMSVSFFQFVFQRVLILYLVAFTLAFFCFDHKKAKWHSFAATLSRLGPPYDYLIGYSEGKVPYDRKQLLSYRLYFSQTVRILPKRPDGYAMLGFCQYHLGDTDAAIASYKKAADILPPFLWFNYNLGYLYLQKKDYTNAVQYLSRAVLSNSELVFKFMLSSKIYLDAAAVIPDFQDKFQGRVREGLRDSYKMLVLSYFYLERFEQVIAVSQEAVKQNLDDDGFFHYYLGVGAYVAKQYVAAVAYFQRGLEKNPDAAEMYYYMALTLKAMDKEPLAVLALQKAQALGASEGESFSNLSKVHLRIL